MAVSQVSSATSGVQQQLTQTQRTRDAVRPSENTETQRTNEAQAAERRAAEQAQRKSETQAAERTTRNEQPRPVVNAQGQKTGTIINTSA